MFIFSAFSQSIEEETAIVSGSCAGGIIFVANSSEWNQATDEFRANCCEGATIEIWNYTNNTSITLTNTADGSNSGDCD